MIRKMPFVVGPPRLAEASPVESVGGVAPAADRPARRGGVVREVTPRQTKGSGSAWGGDCCFDGDRAGVAEGQDQRHALPGLERRRLLEYDVIAERAQGEGPVRRDGQAADDDPRAAGSVADGQDDMPGDRAAGGDELIGGTAEVADGEERGRGPADAAAAGVKARIGTAARLTWSLTRERVPAPPVATQADSRPVRTTAQITGPIAARARSRSTFRPGSSRAGAALGAAVAVTSRPPPESAEDRTARQYPPAGQLAAAARPAVAPAPWSTGALTSARAPARDPKTGCRRLPTGPPAIPLPPPLGRE